ncbi:MAG TPA: hypothetical protein VFS56_12830 [Gemmatimonadaceae bacterium]|nr:hypothetical protein [Gemmatimonadaceae bacterium]
MSIFACGPELTEPADTDVSGTWTASGPAAGLTNVTVDLTQTPDGAITGTYTATGSEGPQFCPPAPPCTVSGTLAGANTVLHVYFELEDAGKFTGQIIGPSLRGAMERTGLVGAIEFALVPNPGQ